MIRPAKELKGFEKISLEPGETKTVSFTLSKRAFAYWNTKLGDWHVNTGNFTPLIGKSSRDIVLEKQIHVISTVAVPHVYTENSTFGDIMSDPDLTGLMENMKQQLGAGMGQMDQEEEGKEANEAITPEMIAAMMRDMPLRSIISFGKGQVTQEMLSGIVAEMNRIKKNR